MKRLIIALSLVFPAYAFGAAAYMPYGSMLGYGDVTIAQELLTYSQNPAAPAYDGGYVHDAISLNPSFALELGDIGQVQSQYDAVRNYDFNNINPTAINTVVTDTNALLASLSKNFYMKGTFATNIPFLPLVIGTGTLGSLYLSADVTAQTRLRFLDSPVQITGPTSIQASGAMYSKTAYRGDLSLGYSRYLMDSPVGELYVGGKFNTYYVGTNKTLASATFDMAANSVTTTQPTMDFTTSTAADLDLGVMLKGKGYQAGFKVTHLGSPSFAYPTIGQNCASITNASDQEACYIAVAHSDEISLNEVHTMNPQMHIEGALLGAGGDFIVASSLDLNPINDLVGDQVQYFTVSTAYAVQGVMSMIVPRIRMGYRKNLAGSGISEMNLGFGLFRILTLDVAEALTTTSFDGNTMPRSIRFNLGLGFNF